MLKFHPIPAFMKTFTNFKKYFWLGYFWLKYIFRIKFKFPILDLMLLSKNSVPFEGLYSSNISFLANGDFCCMMITFANSLDPDQDRQNIDSDMDPNRLTL